jgi:aminopeptidase N
MLEHFMGPEEFRIGVKRFLERFKYGNAVTNNLWRELEGVSSMGLDITNIMDTWTRQMGYPVINVRILTKILSQFSTGNLN